MVTSMLEKAIEIEGLLRIIRDGNPLPETYILLNKKVEELALQAEHLDEKAVVPVTVTQHADFVMAAPTQESAPLSMQPEETEPSAEEELDLSEEDDIILSFEDTTENFFPTDEPEQDVTFGEPSIEESLTFEIKTEEPAQDDPSAYDPEADAKTEPQERITEHNAEIRPEFKEGIVISPQSKRQSKLKSSFSLNDRFLYSRELFNGNMKMFDSTLDFLEGIEDYSIIEEYFYSELDWDPENTNVAAFMNILRPHFKE